MGPSYSAIHLEEVPSTQDLARERFVEEPLVVVAKRQTQGRGRSGAPWTNATRSLAVSVAFRLDWELGRVQVVPLLAGIAAASAMDGTMLKWPNDVLIGDDKVAGLLGELADGVFVMGMGVNLWWPAPPTGVASLYPHDPGEGSEVDLGERWAASLLRLVAQGPENWPIDRYRRLCATLGRDITWTPSGAGRAVDVAASGALVVESDGERVTLSSGSVSHVRTV